MGNRITDATKAAEPSDEEGKVGKLPTKEEKASYVAKAIASLKKLLARTPKVKRDVAEMSPERK